MENNKQELGSERNKNLGGKNQLVLTNKWRAISLQWDCCVTCSLVRYLSAAADVPVG